MKAAIVVLEDHIKMYEQMGVTMGWMTVSQFRCRETKDKKGVINLQLSTLFEPQARWEVEKAIVTILLGVGSEVKPGAPPRSDVERKVQGHVDTLKNQFGRK